MNNKKLNITYDYNDNSKRTRFTVDNPKHKPFKKHEADAGFDIFANEAVVIPANSYAIVSTCLKVAIPEGYVGILKSRSGMACKHGVETGAGVIDSTYRGYINVKLYNTSNKDYTVVIGDKITQMLIQKVNLLDWIEVESLDETERGSNGFGSTGK
ncbi:MAG: dUTP diphosphatase [Deltaproteobacteria bacterium]|nr:MAG: dUTP diphosphatase [Deltaproteobacteria bacterium]